MTDHTDDGLRTDPCGCRHQYVTADDFNEGWECYQPCAKHDRPDHPLAETNADWRGTPLKVGALAVWVVGNHRATEGRVLSWDRDYVAVQPERRSYRVEGGVPRCEEFDTRPQSVDRSKVTILDTAKDLT
jgi:hypothetical protein